MDLGTFLIVLAAVLGAIVAGLLGWLESKEVFSGRKFFSTILRSAVAGAAAGIGYQFVGGISLTVVLGAFAAGAGVDVLGNRLAGSITATGPTTTSPPK